MPPIPELPDPTTVAGAYLAQNMLKRLLGPTADYLGENIKELVERRRDNLEKILSNATKKAGPRLDSPGRVPPKVLKGVINEGTYAEDPIAVEYFGGVLASSRTATGRDDRGARIIKTIDNLSTYQLRTHYLIYSTTAHIFSKSDNTFSLPENRRKMMIFFTMDGYLNSMALSKDDMLNLPILISHIFYGLVSDGLIGENAGWGGKEALQKVHSSATGYGIIVQPSSLGAELFLAAFGHGDKPIDYLLSGNLEEQVDGIPPFVPGAIAVK